MRIAALSAVALLACGDDGGSASIDSGTVDIDAKVCTMGSIGATDVVDEDKGRYITYSADLGMVNGLATTLRMHFRHTSSQVVLPATANLGEDANASSETCFACFEAVSVDGAGNEVARYFQESGTVMFPNDPITTRHLTMMVSSLQLRAATVSGTGALTIDPAGDCITLDASVDQDNVPNAWTCAAADYYAAAGDECDCACGLYDPDCRLLQTNGTPTATPACTDPGMPVCVPTDTGPMCAADVSNDNCTQASLISPGTVAVPNPISGTTAGARHNYNRGLETVTCTNNSQPGPDVVYRIALTMGVAYTITLNGLGPDHDGSFAILGPTNNPATCTDMITNCVGGKDSAGRGSAETTTFTPVTGGEYYIIVDSHNRDDQGPFTLTITGP